MNLGSIIKDKYGIKIKYPDRECNGCGKYPCFPGIDKCKSNFAAYGCIDYSERISQEWL